MKRIVSCLIVGGLLISRQFLAADAYLYQEPLGSPSTAPAAVVNFQYVGVRFQVGQPIELTSLHTVMQGNGSFFAALVPLSSVSSLPEGDPFTEGGVAYWAVFNLSTNYVTPFDVPFDVMVEPGAYAMILGAGQYGSTGAGAISTYSTVPESTAFLGFYGAPPVWVNSSASTWDVSVHGITIPEPSYSVLLAFCGLLFALARRYRGNRKTT